MKLYRQGSSGEAVRDIQSRLSAMGFDASADDTGEFAEATDVAVREFQVAKGLIVDGIVGPDTWREIVNSGHRLGDRLLYHRRPMIRGDDVVELQESLNALGFDAGKADGIFGPDTLRALLDFQRNRNMAEDGICGTVVAGELELMQRATAKLGRHQVAERRWLSELPAGVTGLRIMLDPGAKTPDEAEVAWEAAGAAADILREKGATVVISRSQDTAPEESLRAARINRQGIDVIVSFSLADDAGCHYFATERSESEAGKRLAEEIGKALDIEVSGRAYPMLRETRSPAVVVAGPSIDAATGVAAAAGLLTLFAQPPNIRR